jgi:cytosine/adenosine deaminase-related metal-dependent hydrolase
VLENQDGRTVWPVRAAPENEREALRAALGANGELLVTGHTKENIGDGWAGIGAMHKQALQAAHSGQDRVLLDPGRRLKSPEEIDREQQRQRENALEALRSLPAPTRVFNGLELE